MNAAFSQFMEEAHSAIARMTPELPTQMGMYEVCGSPVAQTGFSPIGDAAALERCDVMQGLADKLRRFPDSALNAEEQASAATLRFYFEYAYERQLIGTAGRPFLRHEYLIKPSSGVQNDPVMFLTGLHPMRHEQDAEDYLSRLNSIGPLLDEAGFLTVERLEAGILPPKTLLAGALSEAKQVIECAPEDNTVYATLEQKTRNIEGVSEQEKKSLLADCLSTLKGNIYPAYERLITTIETLMPKASDNIALSALPDGSSYYDFLLRSATTVDLSADDIHELGQKELAKVERELLALCKEAGISASTIEECNAALNDRNEAPREDNETNRRAVLDRMKSIIKSVEPRLPALFHHLPHGRVTVLPIPRFAELDRNHTYQPPSVDGTRAGYFDLNTKQALAEPDPALKVIAYHEIFPGHHLQISLAQEDQNLPSLRRMITFDAYIEGWAKYAEMIPALHGIDDDIEYRIMRLRHELISTANLVLDTGIHTKNWTAQKGIDFLQTHIGKPEAFAQYIVRRSAIAPAQLCSYKIGMMKFLELRLRMSGALGSSFDVRDFHHEVLRHGAVPLSLLERFCDKRIKTALEG